MDHKKVAEEILSLIGGLENVKQHWHCITRLRFNLNNDTVVDIEALRDIPGVLGVNFQGNQLQVILGANVTQVFVQLDQIINPKKSQSREDEKSIEKASFINLFFDLLSGIFTPILPAIIGTGLLKGILVLLETLELISKTSSEYKVLYTISDAAFYFLPILIAFSAAKKFKTNEYISVTLACIILYPMFNEDSTLSFFGINIPNIEYNFTVIPIILGVWLLSYISKFIEKIVPASIKVIFSPLLILIITSLITLITVAPLGYYIGEYLEKTFSYLFTVAGPLAGLIMGGTLSILVVTGMHYAFFPATFSNFKNLGYDFVLLPISLASNMAQAGATLAVAIKAKDKKLKSIAYSSSISAIFGITEPAIYGVTMKLRKPFYYALIGGAVGGAIIGTFMVKTFAFSLPGISALPTYIEEGSSNFLYICLAIISSYLIAFFLTLCLNIGEGNIQNVEMTESVVAEDELAIDSSKLLNQLTNENVQNKKIILLSPLSGEVISLEKVPDNVFSNKIIGDGIAIIPTDNKVYAPCDCKVSMITPTKHAIGLTTKEGLDLLIHVGIETVSMNGEGFKLLVNVDDEVKAGDILIEFDLDLIKQKSLSTITPILVTNYEDYLSCVMTTNKNVINNKDIILTIN